MEYSKLDMARMCEIALIFGALEAKGQISHSFSDLEEAFTEFEAIYQSWINRVDIETDEEDGYITEYANRVLLERFSI